MSQEPHPTRSLPQETGHELLEGTVTVAFADIVDSSGLVQHLGDEHFVRLINRLKERVATLADPHRGLVPRHEGDGWLVVFGSARQALRWAFAFQAEVAAAAVDVHGFALQARVGLHTGESIQSGRDFFGDHVNFAARIADTAPAGAVHVSELTRRIAAGTRDIEFDEPALIQLRGYAEPALVYGAHVASPIVDRTDR
ncbi:MAG: adenylate/guanylate cyclase domain-containing protein [Actinomycetota bacterium]